MWIFRSGFVLLAYALMGLYSGTRTLALWRLFFPLARAYLFWPLYVLICFSYILVFFLKLDRIQALRQGVMYSLPALVYYSLGLLFFEFLALALTLGAHFLPIIGPSSSYYPLTTAIALGITILVLVHGRLHAKKIRVVRYDVAISKLKGQPPLKITLLSDIHIGANVDKAWLSAIVDRANGVGGDLILLAGDIFDNRLGAIKDRPGIEGELRRLKAPLGVYACLGNHDVDWRALREGASIEPIVEFLQNSGVKVLLDEAALVDDRFYVIGRRDRRPIGAGRERKSAQELLQGLNRELPLIILSHQPVDFPAEEAAGADLILSGHTHGGQFFPGTLATARIFKKAGAQHYGHWRGKTAQGIITSGAATWGPVLRVLTNSEIVEININHN